MSRDRESGELPSPAVAVPSADRGGVLLEYESRPEVQRRPKWVYPIAGVYGLIILALAGLPAYLLFSGDRDLLVPSAITVTLLLICEAGLLFVPVRVGTRRPVTRRSLWIPIIVSGLLAGFLMFGGAIALAEYLDKKLSDNFSTAVGWVALGLSIAAWLIWSVIFALVARSHNPADLGAKLHRWLISGSVLELLVAVPTHLVVRKRTDCCAGMATMTGICIGVVVMVLGFGPSVVFLYYRRWRQVAQKR